MKVVIAGSASLPKKMAVWVECWNSLDACVVSDYPKPIPSAVFHDRYPAAHRDFFKNIAEADILFVANEDKSGIEGYIGAETFAELAFALAQKLIYGRDINLVLANKPSREVQCYSEIMLWKKLGWVEIMKSK